jgi:Cupredoxin-like domain
VGGGRGGATGHSRPPVRAQRDHRSGAHQEFESYELNREKVVAAKSKITVYVGPLEPGRYPFFGDFHKDSANGVLIAK